MKPLLLDTHVIIWLGNASRRLPPFLREAIEAAENLLVSHVTALEVQIKYQKHSGRFEFSLQDLERTMKAFSCTELPIEYEDIRALDQIQFLHSDPFDQLLMSQASRRSLRLASLDRNIIKTFTTSKAFDLLTEHEAPH